MSNFSTVEIPPVAGEPPLPPEPPPHRRRGLWIALAAGLAALAIAVPLILFLILRGSGEPSATPTATANPAPTATAPSPAPTAGPTTTQASPVPDGRIPVAQFMNATLNIPPWPADNVTGPSGLVAFTAGQATIPLGTRGTCESLGIVTVSYGDVDRDGAPETVAPINCSVAQAGSEQLVAFDRDTSGRIVTLGTIVSTTGPVRTFEDTTFRIGSDGTVTVRVADFQRCCGDQTPQIWQYRSYGWTGTGFRQTGGPSSFPVNPQVTETGVAAGDLVFGPPVDGTRHGTLTLSVTYLYGARPDHLILVFGIPADVRREGTTWPQVYPTQGGSFEVHLPTPAAGTSTSYTFPFSRPSAGSGGEIYLYLLPRTKQDVPLSESNPYNMSQHLIIRTVD